MPIGTLPTQSATPEFSYAKLGTSPFATVGLLRVGSPATAANRQILAFRTAANSADIEALASDTSNNLYLGGNSGQTNQPANTYFQSAGVFAFYIGATVAPYFQVDTTATKVDVLQVGDYARFSATGGIVASVGKIRLPHTSGIYARDTLNTKNIPIVGADGSDRVFLGDSSGGAPLIFYDGTSGEYGYAGGGLFQWVTSNVTRVSLSTTGVDLGTGSVIKLSGTVATTGDIRAANATTVVAARNAANTGNISLVGSNTNDRVTSEGYVQTVHVAAITATASIANTETRVLGATIAANKLKAGDQIVFTIMGVETNTTDASTSVWRVRIGGVTLTGAIVASNSYTMGMSARTNTPFIARAIVTILTVGATGTALGQVMATLDNSSALIPPSGGGLTAAVTIDTTAEREVEITVISGAATTTWDIHSGSFEIKRIV